MKKLNQVLSFFMAVVLVFTITACEKKPNIEITSLEITNCDRATLKIGYTVKLKTNAPEEIKDQLEWKATNDCVSVDSTGFVVAKQMGVVTVTVSYKEHDAKAIIEVVDESGENSGFIGDTLPQDWEQQQSGDASRPSYDDNSRQPQADENSSSNTSNKNNGHGNIIDWSEQDSDRNDFGSQFTQSGDIGTDESARDKFYGDSDPADSNEEALERSSRGELSGAEEVPDQAPTLSTYRPKSNGRYIKNNVPYFADENTYVVVNAEGEEVFRVYRGGGYITLEEVAAYVYAFGDVPKNYVSDKKTRPSSSKWGENLRLNHTKFSGSTSKYPYEPMLPNISGCGGDFQYYEIDIGTTGTDCDDSYDIRIYNDGSKITRGAARIVYARFDENGNKIIDPDEKYVFYTYNHYNDFQEYLNYYGGWGTMFGNITGGGTLSSKKHYNPTPYVPVVCDSLIDEQLKVAYWFDPRFTYAIAA